MNKFIDKDRTETPDQAELQADISVKIELFVGVVPPSRMKQFVKGPTANQFDGCREQHAPEKKRQTGMR